MDDREFMDVDPQGSHTMIESAPSTQTPDPAAPQDDFSQQAGEPQPSLLAELLDFLVNNKAWWLTPIIVVLLLVGLLVILGGTAAAPFIYALF